MPEEKSGAGKILTGVAAVFAAAAAVVIVVLVLSGDSNRSRGNPYAYDLTGMDRALDVEAAYTESGSFDPGFDRIAGVALGDGDEIYVCGDSTLSVFSPGGERTASFDLPESPNCVALFRRSFFHGVKAPRKAPIFIGLMDHVICLDDRGEVTAEWSSLGENAVITSMAAGPSKLCVADGGSRLVWIFDHGGRMKSVLGREGDGFVVPSPNFDVALDPEGSLWVANPGERRLEKFDPSLTRVAMWGKSSMEIDGFCGCCNPSNFAIDSAGRFFTAEKGIPRVKRYESDGSFQVVVAASTSFDENTVGLDVAVDSKGRVVVPDPARGKVRIFTAR